MSHRDATASTHGFINNSALVHKYLHTAYTERRILVLAMTFHGSQEYKRANKFLYSTCSCKENNIIAKPQ
jgi:hypothetical protein